MAIKCNFFVSGCVLAPQVARVLFEPVSVWVVITAVRANTTTVL